MIVTVSKRNTEMHAILIPALLLVHFTRFTMAGRYVPFSDYVRHWSSQPANTTSGLQGTTEIPLIYQGDFGSPYVPKKPVPIAKDRGKLYMTNISRHRPAKPDPILSRIPNVRKEIIADAEYIPPTVQMYFTHGVSCEGEELKGPAVIGDPLCLIVAMTVERSGFDFFLFNCSASDNIKTGVPLIDEQGCNIAAYYVNQLSAVYYLGADGKNDTIMRQMSFRAFHFNGTRKVHFTCKIKICQACPDHACQRNAKVELRNDSRHGERAEPVFYKTISITKLVEVNHKPLDDIKDDSNSQEVNHKPLDDIKDDSKSQEDVNHKPLDDIKVDSKSKEVINHKTLDDIKDDIKDKVPDIEVEGDVDKNSTYVYVICGICALIFFLVISFVCCLRCHLKKKTTPVQEAFETNKV